MTTYAELPDANLKAQLNNKSLARRWLKLMVSQWAKPNHQEKPVWLHLPDRVWRRQSALLTSLHQHNHD